MLANCWHSLPKMSLQLGQFHLELETTEGNASGSSKGGHNIFSFCLNSHFGPVCISGFAIIWITALSWWLFMQLVNIWYLICRQMWGSPISIWTALKLFRGKIIICRSELRQKTRTAHLYIWTNIFLETRLINKHEAFDFVISSRTSGVKITTEF